ncbi:transcriptional regulator with XRE-family HTH domain [Chitinophaga niastensis]|uniref:Transcriptional regulator with XRE-family HTH domain n=1 Tax=Chitinophaga niastensis TaxID=536980 RepID=A0A2P8HDD3_CHINA|nr:pentapeptide repeat-containing protein [Chitinophaga niastensis]PSL44245.1 transcriptional regulator with XRE-family HTH domain [Chitinophaga niastensis]
MLNTNNMIGNKIAEARKKINISQAELAQRLFISSQAVGKWERGESMPDITTFNRLAEILGVDLNYFSESFQSKTTEVAPVELLVKRSAELPSGKQEKKLSWDMSNGNWVDADFSGLKNLHEKFGSSNMQRCKFIGSELSGLLLKSNNVDSCDFSGSDISSSHIQNSSLVNNIFKNSSLREAEFSGSHIKGCDFSDADFTGAVFKSCAFEKNTVANAVWNRTSFIGTAIADMVFDGTLEDCYFENSAFTRVTFQHATLINTFFKCNTFFKKKSLKGLRFIDCQADRLTYEFLKSGKADLTGITLLTA